MTRLQKDPPEGARGVIERELARQDRQTQTVSVEARDIVRLLGDLDAAQIAKILALAPSFAELEQAAAWARGEGDQPSRQGVPLAGKAATIFEIVTPVEEDSDFP